MKAEDSTLDEARAAKAKAADILGDYPVVGLGITRCGTGYGVKVNLSEAVAGQPLPAEIRRAHQVGSRGEDHQAVTATSHFALRSADSGPT